MIYVPQDNPTDYPLDKFEELAKRFDFKDHPKEQAIYNILNGIKPIYLVNRDYEEERNGFTNRKLKNALNGIMNTAVTLSRKIAEANDVTHAVLWQADQTVYDAARQLAHKGIHDPAKPESLEDDGPFGQKIIAIQMPPHEGFPGPGYAPIHQKPEDLKRAIQIIENYARHAQGTLPQQKSGPKDSYATDIFISNARSIWIEQLERPFTVDWQKGEAVSQAAQFTVAALRIIDPDVKESWILTRIRTRQA